MPEREAVTVAGAQHDDDAQKPDGHRDAAPQADLLAQHRDRHQGDEERHGEEDRVAGRHRQDGKGVEPHRSGEHGADGADRRPPGMPRDQRAIAAVAEQKDGDKRKAHQPGEKHGLERGIIPAQELHHHVMRGVGGESGKRQEGAAQGGGHLKWFRRWARRRAALAETLSRGTPPDARPRQAGSGALPPATIRRPGKGLLRRECGRGEP